jgi:protoporphyrinogen IX oxidase
MIACAGLPYTEPAMLWVKAFHIFFVIAWFAELFYLPRLLVYHSQLLTQTPGDEGGHARFCTMERKLKGMGIIGMAGTWIFGIWMLSLEPDYLHAGWLHAKLGLVVLLSGYQGWLGSNLRKFAARKNTHSERFWRIANEVPALVLFAVVILVVVKP